MNHYELIDKSRSYLDAAEVYANDNQPAHFDGQMQLLLDLLLEELLGITPRTQTTPAKTFNPEEILADIAISIKYRTISLSERWNIVFYHDRITCVPIGVDIPQEIILHEFTEGMVKKGFSTIYWNHLKKNVVELYKELHK